MPAMTWLPPNQTTARVVKFIAMVITGMVNITTFIALNALFFSSVLAFLNFSSSKLSLTNDFMTLIFVRFSCVTVLSASSFFCISVKRGKPIFRMM